MALGTSNRKRKSEQESKRNRGPVLNAHKLHCVSCHKIRDTYWGACLLTGYKNRQCCNACRTYARQHSPRTAKRHTKFTADMKLKEAELLVAEVGSAQAAILLTAQTNSAEEDEDLPAQLQEDAGSVPVTEAHVPILNGSNHSHGLMPSSIQEADSMDAAQALTNMQPYQQQQFQGNELAAKVDLLETRLVAQQQQHRQQQQQQQALITGLTAQVEGQNHLLTNLAAQIGVLRQEQLQVQMHQDATEAHKSAAVSTAERSFAAAAISHGKV